MRVVPCVGVLLACLALTGCSALGKKPADSGARPSLDTNPPKRTDIASTAPAVGAAPGMIAPTGTSGILAGQVIDTYGRKPPLTYIQVSQPRQGNGMTVSAPIEVAADKDGYFTIQGLQPGQAYQLTARSKDGEHLLAGITYTTPPNPRVVIRMSQDFANGTTPAMPPAPSPQDPPPPPANVQNPAPAPAWPGAGGGDAPPPSSNQQRQPPAPPQPGGYRPPPAWPPTDRAWNPGAAGANNSGRPARPPMPDRPAGLGNPVGMDEAPTPRVPVAPDRVAGDPPVALHEAPPANIPGAGPLPRNDGGRPTEGDSPPIPFCSLAGRQLNNFALYDIDGRPWEYRQRHNRLTLVDFWGTWCPACLQAIPSLTALHNKYSPNGLEIVGIAYETGLPQQQLDAVNRVRQRLHIPYTILMGGDRVRCPVRAQFGVAMWPTVVLIDENGRIIWRETGLDKQRLQELEHIIRQQLNVRN